MKIKLLVLLFLAFSPMCFAQSGFVFEKEDNKVVIPFQLINNLIFIPITVNGVELHFLLDTGVDETVLISLEDKEDFSINNIEKIKLSGLGSNEPIAGLKSTNNVLSIKGLVDRHHTIYVVLDQSFNFSTSIGIPVNGIIGYHFFKDNLIEINYKKKKITVYKESEEIRNKIKKKFTPIPISIEKNKPYTNAFVTIDETKIPAKLLLDLGNSDAIWLFQGINEVVKVPKKSFDDFLGNGFSGEIYGKRTKISKFNLDKFEFKKPIIVMPDTTSTKGVKMVKNRIGSIGGEIFKRFSIIFDYKNGELFLKKNSNYKNPFQYNLSGIELQNEGTEWVQEKIALNTVDKKKMLLDISENNTVNNFKYKFSLKPVYSIATIRKNSPAELSGLQKGDIVKSINNIPVYKKSLQKNNEILQSDDGKWITIEVERNDQILEFKFQVWNVL